MCGKVPYRVPLTDKCIANIFHQAMACILFPSFFLPILPSFCISSDLWVSTCVLREQEKGLGPPLGPWSAVLVLSCSGATCGLAGTSGYWVYSLVSQGKSACSQQPFASTFLVTIRSTFHFPSTRPTTRKALMLWLIPQGLRCVQLGVQVVVDIVHLAHGHPVLRAHWQGQQPQWLTQGPV